MILAVDPGHRGAAVLLDDRGQPVAWWSWRPLDRKAGRVYALDVSEQIVEASGVDPRRLTNTLAGVGQALAGGVRFWLGAADYDLVAEGLFVPRGSSGRAPVELGRTVGWLTAGLREQAASYEEPMAGQWRPAVLGCPANTSSDQAERLALALWRSRWRGEPCEDPHVAEAHGIGWWRHTRRAA